MLKIYDMDRLFEYSNKLIQEADTSFLRYMYDEINWQSRMIGLVGPRGVGKTALVLQYDVENGFLNVVPLWPLGLTY